MKVSQLIKRLEQLKALAGEDVPVAVFIVSETDERELATAEIDNVRLVDDDGSWVSSSHQKDNTHKIVVIQ